MNTEIYSLLTLITLSISLIIFLISLVFSYKEEHIIRGNYNFFFSLFLTSWILIELINHFTSFDSELVFQFFHLLILFVLAIWMNLRFFWAIRKAKSDE